MPINNFKKMIYLFLADGFEETEALGTVDILRRCNLQVQMLSVTGKRVVTGAHGIVVKADSLFRKNHLVQCDALVFPGGLRGAETMRTNSVLKQAIVQQSRLGTLVAAICAAPMVLGEAGVLKGKHATIYPGLEKYITGSIYHNNAFVIEHDNFITACGPAATSMFAFTIARRLVRYPEQVDEVERDMCFTGHDISFEQVQKF